MSWKTEQGAGAKSHESMVDVCSGFDRSQLASSLQRAFNAVASPQGCLQTCRHVGMWRPNHDETDAAMSRNAQDRKL